MSKNTILRSVAPMVAVLGLTACVGAVAPTVAVMPAANKPPDVFQQDSADCQHYGDGLVTPIRTYTNNRAEASAVIGAALGAGASAGSGRGAGMTTASFTGLPIQQQFDVAYSQCMYTRGHQVPGFQANTYALPPPPSYGAARSAPPLGFAPLPTG